MDANAELVRRSHELFAQRRVDEWVALFAEDVEVPALALAGTESVYRGREGLRRWCGELEASGTMIDSYADELTTVDERRVVVAGRIVVRAGGGRGYGTMAGWVYTVEHGLIRRVETYPHPAAALRAVGLDAAPAPF